MGGNEDLGPSTTYSRERVSWGLTAHRVRPNRREVVDRSEERVGVVSRVLSPTTLDPVDRLGPVPVRRRRGRNRLLRGSFSLPHHGSWISPHDFSLPGRT